jgi:gluconokinase
MVIIIYGVSAVGKTTVGEMLAAELKWKFYDADDFHSAANKAKMAAGIPLDDLDRQGWLESLRDLISTTMARGQNSVLACSALKQRYRDLLKINDDVKFVLLYADYDTIEKRIVARRHHFMNPSLLKSQFDTLEMPTGDDTVLDAAMPAETIVREIVNALT